MSFLVLVTPFCIHYKWRFVITISNSGAYFFFECFVVAFALYAYLKSCNRKFVPSVLVNMNSSPTVKVAMKGKVMFSKSLYTMKPGSYKSHRKTFYVFSIHTSSDGIKSAQMLVITDFHTVTHVMNAPVNLTLYDNKFGLQGYYYSKT